MTSRRWQWPAPLARLSGLGSDALAVARAYWMLRQATQIGPRVRAWGRVVAQNGGSLIVHERVRLVGTITPLELGVGAGGSLEIGARTFINYGTSIAAAERVSIGPDCLIGTYVMIIDNDFHRLEPERRNERPPSRPVTIGANVWLGGHVVVLPGVSIGAGSAIGAGSIVTRDIPPRSLAVGNPAKVIRQL